MVHFLTKKTKINEGEVPQYHVEDSHPAIIEPWKQVQAELERRKNSRTRHRQTSPFSGKIFCADCGEIFGAKTWHSTDHSDEWVVLRFKDGKEITAKL